MEFYTGSYCLTIPQTCCVRCPLFFYALCFSVPFVFLCPLFFCALCFSVPFVFLCPLFFCALCFSVPFVFLCPLFFCALCFSVPFVFLCNSWLIALLMPLYWFSVYKIVSCNVCFCIHLLSIGYSVYRNCTLNVEAHR